MEETREQNPINGVPEHQYNPEDIAPEPVPVDDDEPWQPKWHAFQVLTPVRILRSTLPEEHVQTNEAPEPVPVDEMYEEEAPEPVPVDEMHEEAPEPAPVDDDEPWQPKWHFFQVLTPVRTLRSTPPDEYVQTNEAPEPVPVDEMHEEAPEPVPLDNDEPLLT